jgi:hypothetical protein
VLTAGIHPDEHRWKRFSETSPQSAYKWICRNCGAPAVSLNQDTKCMPGFRAFAKATGIGAGIDPGRFTEYLGKPRMDLNSGPGA